MFPILKLFLNGSRGISGLTQKVVSKTEISLKTEKCETLPLRRDLLHAVLREQGRIKLQYVLLQEVLGDLWIQIRLLSHQLETTSRWQSPWQRTFEEDRGEVSNWVPLMSDINLSLNGCQSNDTWLSLMTLIFHMDRCLSVKMVVNH